MKPQLARRAVAAGLLLCSLALHPTARADDLIQQHRKLMLQSIAQCTPKTVQKLLGTPYVDPDDPQGRYLLVAIGANCPDQIRIQTISALLGAGANPNVAESPFNPLLVTVFRSFRSDYLTVTTKLFQAGLKIIPLSDDHATYLHFLSWPSSYAAAIPFSDAAQIYDYLIAQGVNPQTLNDYAQTPLISNAIRWGSVEQADYLLGKGLNIDDVDGCGMSAIDYLQIVHVGGANYMKLADYPAFRANNPALVARADALFSFLKSRGAKIRELPRTVTLHCAKTSPSH